MADANGPGTATAYVWSGQVDDPNTAATATDDATATRYYTFGGAMVAVRTNNGQLSLMLRDEQGSTNVMMPVTVQTSGALASATLADAQASTRTSYTPYGQLRGADNLAVDRGWLGQVEDRVVGTGASSTGTGLTYLNARYYDPATSRFISPDPLMNPGDPKTLDPYRYANNNPVVFTDATGLKAIGQYDCVGTSCKSTSAKAIVAAVDPNGQVQRSLRVIAQIKKDQASAMTPTQAFFHVDGSTFKAGGLGLVNFGGGAVNGLSSMVNGITSLATGGRAPKIRSIGIVGDYDMYKYSSWSDTGSSILATFMFGGEAAAGTKAVEGVESATKLEAAGASLADSGGGNFVYRALNAADREAVDAGLGITAKNAEGTWSRGDHVANGSSRASWSNDPWIATSRDPSVAAAFDSGHGVVRINLDLVDSATAEAWKIYPRVNGEAGLPYHYSFWQQEVSVFKSIPAGALG